MKAYLFHLIAFGIVTATMAVLWLDARPKHFLICDADCGETLIANAYAALDFAKYGVRYALLEPQGGPAETPLLYTHNVNIGSMTFVAMEALGIHTFEGRSVLPLFAFGLGLFYVFLSARLFTGSGWAGIIVLLVFATTYWGLGMFAFNALRAWHMLALFGVIYHVGRLTETASVPWMQYIGLAFAATIAFGCGYDFWVPGGAVAVMLVLARQPHLLCKTTLIKLCIIGSLFIVPFMLRQLQISYALGADYLWHDMYYSMAIKMPYATDIFPIPSLEEIDKYYAAHHVHRPPAQPANNLGQIYESLCDMISGITIPRWGIITCASFTGALFAALCICIFRVRLLRNYTQCPLRFFTQINMQSALPALLLPVVLGLALGMAVFMPFSLHVDSNTSFR